MHSLANRQKGLALITVLFIFALVSLLAVSMQSRQKMSMAQAGASISLAQAQIIALSAEDIAKAGLSFDAKRDMDANQPWDTASELWNQPFPVELSGVQIEIHVRDLQGLFNLNSLKAVDGKSPADAVKRFERLMDELGIQDFSSIASQLKDWLDKDSGASSFYQNLELPYSASGIELSHPSELMLIDGVDRDTYLELEPYITALPYNTPLNINTSHAAILQAWDSNLSTEDAATVIDMAHAGSCGPKVRNDNVIKDEEELYATDTLKDLVAAADDKTKTPTGAWNEGDFVANTQYFSILIRVKLADRELILESIIKRDMTAGNEFIGVVYRDFSRKIEDISRLKIINC